MTGGHKRPSLRAGPPKPPRRPGARPPRPGRAPPFRLVRPADPWLRGERTPQTAIAAWRALAGLPLDLIRYARGLPVVLNIVPIAIYLAIEIGGPFVPALLVLC